MFRIIGAAVVYGFALFGLATYLQKSSCPVEWWQSGTTIQGRPRAPFLFQKMIRSRWSIAVC